MVIAAAALAVAVLIAIVALAVRGSPKSNVSTGSPTTVPQTTLSTAPATTAASVTETLAPIASSTIAATSTTAPAAGHLQLDSSNVDLGASTPSAQVLLSNSGPGPVAWKASVGPAWLAVRPTSGTLAPNTSQSVTVAVDRSKAPAGTFSVQVAFVATGTGSVGAVLTVTGAAPPPTTTSLAPTTTAAPGPQISGVSATQVSNCEARVTATITDSVPVSTASVAYTLPGGSHASAGMVNSNGQWTATITGWTAGGPVTYAVSATDAQSASTTYPTGSLTVTSCP
jgi:serine-aspartate repeat-containing protein C/D/E